MLNASIAKFGLSRMGARHLSALLYVVQEKAIVNELNVEKIKGV
jgi:hypothetical protein